MREISVWDAMFNARAVGNYLTNVQHAEIIIIFWGMIAWSNVLMVTTNHPTNVSLAISPVPPAPLPPSAPRAISPTSFPPTDAPPHPPPFNALPTAPPVTSTLPTAPPANPVTSLLPPELASPSAPLDTLDPTANASDAITPAPHARTSINVMFVKQDLL